MSCDAFHCSTRDYTVFGSFDGVYQVVSDEIDHVEMVGSYQSIVSSGTLGHQFDIQPFFVSRTSAIFIALFVFVMCVPTLLAHQIDETNRELTVNGMYYKYSVGFSTLMMQNGCLLMKANLWLTGICLKVSR